MRPVSFIEHFFCAVLAVIMTAVFIAVPGCIASAFAEERGSTVEVPSIPQEAVDKLAKDLADLSKDLTKPLSALPETPRLVGSNIPTTETYTVRAGVRADWLWNRFRAQGRPAAEWPAFWKAACAASRLSCTDTAWRRISPGTQITIPRDPKVVAAEHERFRTIAQQVEEIRKEIKEFAAIEVSQAETKKTFARMAILFAASTLIFAAMFFVLWKQVAELARENNALRAKLERQSAVGGELPAVTILPAGERNESSPQGTSCCDREGADAHFKAPEQPCPEDGCTQGFHPDGTVTPADGRDRTTPGGHDHSGHTGHRH